VLGRHALVAEVAIDLVDPLEAADDETLEIELRCDAQVQIHVERVVVRLEGPRNGAAGNRLHHRRLDLQKAPRVEEGAQPLDQPCAQQEDLAGLGVDDEVDVALAIPGLDVLEAVPLLRKRTQRFGEERERLHGQRELTRPRAEHAAGDADEIADVQIAERCEVVAQLVGAGVQLDAARAVHEMRECRLAVITHGDEPPGEAHGTEGLQLGVARLVQPRGELTGPVRDGIAAPERIKTTTAQRFELFLTLAHEVVRVAVGHAFPRAASRYALMNSSRSPSMTASTLPTSTPVRWSLMRCSGWKV